MDNIWGKGGLFEQAISQKMGLQGAQADSMRMDSDTRRMGVNNEYDLGLRRNQVDLGLLDVSRQNADTNRFNADTDRLYKSPPGLISSTVAGNLGLRTYNPVREEEAVAYGQKYGANLMRKPELKNGGMVMKPKMVKQPGYMHGGKITMPKGYKAGGKIGNVKKDDGTDKVEVMAREGEYFLNPETVAGAFGGGSYEAGVRNLNQIVRDTTGKEPGPTHMGKSGKQGFADSGGVGEDFWRDRARQMYEKARTIGSGTTGSGTMYGSSTGTVGDSVEGVRQADRMTRAADVGRNIGSKVGSGVRTAAGVVRSAAPNAMIAAPVAGFGDYKLADDGIDSSALGTIKYLFSGEGGKAVDSLRKGAVEAGLDAASGIAKTVDFATGLVGGNTNLAGRLRKGVEADLGAGLKPQEGAAQSGPIPAGDSKAGAGRGFVNPTPPATAAEQPKQPSLREMLLNRIENIDRVAATNGGLGMQYWNNARNEALGALTKLEQQDMQSAGVRNAAMAKAAMQAREDADKRIAERFQIPKFDKEGRVVGFEKNPNAANDLRDFAAQVFGMDLYAMSPEQQDKVFNAYDINSRGTRRLNERFASEGGDKALMSMVPRIGANSLRADGEISIGDIGDPNISLGDWLTSFGPNKLEKMVLRDPVTGQRVAGRHVLMREDGTIDQDLIEQMNRAAAANQKK